ncbi:hypothetical protein [Mogibacterium diversum]
MKRIKWYKDLLKLKEWTDVMMEISKEIDELEMRMSICKLNREIVLANAYKLKIEGNLKALECFEKAFNDRGFYFEPSIVDSYREQNRGWLEPIKEAHND